MQDDMDIINYYMQQHTNIAILSVKLLFGLCIESYYSKHFNLRRENAQGNNKLYFTAWFLQWMAQSHQLSTHRKAHLILN